MGLANAVGASVEGVVVWAYPIALSANVVTAVPNIADNARRTATEAANQVFGNHWPEQFMLLVREGNAAHALIKESQDAEMLVVGSRGHGGFTGLLLGSVSAECAEHAKCPVLVMHDTKTKAAGSGAENRSGL